MKFASVALAAFVSLLIHLPVRALGLYPTRSAPTDLAVIGQLIGLKPGEVRYLHWDELRALPTTALIIEEGFLRGPQQVTALFLCDLLKALPTTAKADCILATCYDGYASVFSTPFISVYKPFLALEINGKGPTQWPMPELVYNPGPYVITASTAVVPEVATFLDIGHKKPSGIVTLEIGNYAERFESLYTGSFAQLTPEANKGRTIWINSCASCHPGPGTNFSGTKSGKPFSDLYAFAAYSTPYFKQYVRDPKSLSPIAKMEPHPGYTDEQLSELIAFITSAKKP